MISDIFKSVKDFFGEGNEFVDSTQIALKERISSPFYGYFIIFWILINWRLIYIAFFIDQDKLFEKTGLLRIEYLNILTPTLFSWNALFHFFIGPAILTCLVFWIFPYGTRIFYRKNIKNQKALRIIELQESRKETREKKGLVIEAKELRHEETSLLKEELEKLREEKKAFEEAPEILWEKDFKNFQSSLLYWKFKQVIDSIYKYSGHVSYGGTYTNPAFQIDTDILVYADSNELLTINQIDQSITLTNKGKYFVKQYSESESRL